jgi:hypothetical protein
MDWYKIPALSIAVIENYKIVWAKAYGVTDVGTSKSVTTKTLFQAGSISKPVAAVGTLSLVEKGQVPKNEFTKTERSAWAASCRTRPGLRFMAFPVTT